jgi:hypothetical protein
LDKQLLHLVIGGELKDTTSREFADLDKVDMVGVYPNYAEAEKIWRAKSQSSVDNALIRYFIIHVHRLLDPDEEAAERAKE